MARCDFCFQDKMGLEPPVPRLKVRVCKACNYKVQQVIGFLIHSGAGIFVQPELEPEEKPPQTPPDSLKTSSEAPKSKKRASKKPRRVIPTTMPLIDPEN